jgi:hypothetical protein
MASSAFGVDHGFIDKALNAKQFRSLVNVKNTGEGRNAEYARRRLANHTSGKMGQFRPTGTRRIDVADNKKSLQDLTRTPYGQRKQNRRAATYA